MGRAKILIRELGQLRLDPGSLPAGWFPLPDAVGMLLGCHPFASRSLGEYKDSAGTKHVVCNASCVKALICEFHERCDLALSL